MLRRLPRAVAGCVRLVWDASRSACLWAASLQVIGGVALAVELLAGKQLLTAVLDAADRDQGVGAVTPELLLVTGATVVLAVATALQVEQQRIVAELVTRHVDQRLLDVAAAVDLEAYETPAFYDRLLRAQVAGQSRPWQMTTGLVAFLSGSVTSVVIALALLAIQPLLLPLVLLASVPLWFAMLRNSRAAHAFAYGITNVDRERRYIGHLLMGREFAKEVRVFDLPPFLRVRFDELYDRRLIGLRGLVRARLRRLIPAGLLAAVLVAATLGILVVLVLDERMDLAGATVAAVAVQQLATRLRSTYSSVGSLYEGVLFLDDFHSFLDLEPALRSSRPTAIPPSPFATIRLEGVEFTYPGADQPALTDVSCEIERGEVVALVGANGSGKSTFAKLLCGLYHPSHGRICWDRRDLAECDPVLVRDAVTAVFQDFAQYHLPADENIWLGRPAIGADGQAVQEAARRAGADGFLSALPQGYATRLGRQFDGGRELSVGQWQRVALARAFFRGGPLLVLDEPTAALDPAAEHDLFDRIRELAGGRTVVLISHRFSSVRSADRIYVLDAGRIIEQGRHDELMALGGRYAAMFALQAAAYVGESRPQPFAANAANRSTT